MHSNRKSQKKNPAEAPNSLDVLSIIPFNCSYFLCRENSSLPSSGATSLPCCPPVFAPLFSRAILLLSTLFLGTRDFDNTHLIIIKIATVCASYLCAYEFVFRLPDIDPICMDIIVIASWWICQYNTSVVRAIHVWKFLAMTEPTWELKVCQFTSPSKVYTAGKKIRL